MGTSLFKVDLCTPANVLSRIPTAPMPPSRSLLLSTSARIFASSHPVSASTSTSSSERTTLAASRCHSFAASLANCYPAWSSCRTSASFTAISSLRTYCFAKLARPMSESLTLVAVARRRKRSTLTSSLDSIAVRKSYSAAATDWE